MSWKAQRNASSWHKWHITIAFFALYAIACIEELVIVATMKQYDPFRKSIFSKSQRTVLDTPRAESTKS